MFICDSPTDVRAHSAAALLALFLLGGCGGGGPSNSAPSARNVSTSGFEDTAIPIMLLGADANGDLLEFRILTPPAHGSLSRVGSGSMITYMPVADFNGADQFTFQVVDPDGATSAAATVQIAVQAQNDVPTAAGASLTLDEDEQAQITLSASDIDGDALVYQVLNAGTLGNAQIDANGRLTYTPAADRNGSDQLTFAVQDSGGALSAPARVDIDIRAIDDPPRITLPAHATNSAYTEDTVVEYVVSDVDGEPVTTNLSVVDADVATVIDEADQQRLLVHPVGRGTTEIVLAASDGRTTVEKTLSFEVTDVTKQVQLQFADPVAQAVRIVNDGEADVSFTLSNNGFTSFESLEAVVQHVRDMPEDFAGEPFERKLWRFLIANVVHEYPLTEALWLLDPLVTVNSFGWGLCGNVASAYARIARAAGLDARVWGLGGHVVPEVMSGGVWSVIDPDLSVFYRISEQRIAGIAELQAQPGLITNPVDPLYPIVDPGPYGAFVGSIYASAADNETDSRWNGPAEALNGRVILPAGAQLTYPGQWDDAPLGYNGTDIRPVRYFRHALLELPDGWTGTLRMPWMLRTIIGSARVRVGGIEYESNDPALAARLRQPGFFLHEIEVLRADSGVGLVFYVNVVGFAVASSNDIAVTGEKVWALDVAPVTLPPENRRGTPLPAAAMKNTPPPRP